MDKICVVVAARVRLDDCKEVPRPKEGEVADMIAVREERGSVEMILDDIKEPVSGSVRIEMRFVEVILGDIEESATADWPESSMAEKGYGSSEVVPLVSQQSGPLRPWPAAPAQHQLLPLDSQRFTSVKPSN